MCGSVRGMRREPHSTRYAGKTDVSIPSMSLKIIRSAQKFDK